MLKILLKKYTHNGRFTELGLDKLRGGYYTSPQIAAWLANWAIRKPSDTVLEPSCGDGVFLEAAASRLIQLGGSTKSIATSLAGKIHESWNQSGEHRALQSNEGNLCNAKSRRLLGKNHTTEKPVTFLL